MGPKTGPSCPCFSQCWSYSLSSFVHMFIYIWYAPLRSTFDGVSNTFQTQCNDPMYICLPQCNQTSACLNATKHLLGSTQPKQCPGIEFHVLYLDKFRLGISDLRFSSLNSSSTDPRSKIQDFRKLLSRNLGSTDPRSKIQDFRKLLSRNLGSTDPRSKIQDVRKLFSRNLGSMDPRSKIQDFRKLLSRNLGSMDPRSKISENSCPEVLDPSRNLGSM